MPTPAFSRTTLRTSDVPAAQARVHAYDAGCGGILRACCYGTAYFNGERLAAWGGLGAGE
jgi:hypothetical protein